MKVVPGFTNFIVSQLRDRKIFKHVNASLKEITHDITPAKIMSNLRKLDNGDPNKAKQLYDYYHDLHKESIYIYNMLVEFHNLKLDSKVSEKYLDQVKEMGVELDGKIGLLEGAMDDPVFYRFR